MATKSTRHIDPAGRIMIPKHIRKELNLNPGNHITVTLDDDGTIRIKRTAERCALCGNDVENSHHTIVTIENEKKKICFDCAQKVARAMMK